MLPSGYKDPAKETLANGRSIADIVGVRGGKGMPGVIVSSAGIDGKPLSFDPHDRSQVVINIEPDSPNGSSLALTQFTKSAVEQAMAAAAKQIPGNDINAIRERAAMAFEELAKIANSGVQRSPQSPPPAAEPRAVAAINPPPVPAVPAPAGAVAGTDAIDRSYSPMAAFGLKKSSTTQSRPSPGAAANVAARISAPPTKLVYFEKEGIGTVPAFFHDLVVEVDRDEDGFTETGFIVLIYDLNFEQAAARWFPPANDPYKRPWAMQINNDRRLYLVHTTGFQYVYADREFCVLMVEKAVDSEI